MLANEAALATVDAAPTSGTSTAASRWHYEYSRYNYHGTDFYADRPYRSSDHDPVILGLPATRRARRRPTCRSSASTTTTAAWPRSTPRVGGARRAVKAARAANPNTVFAAAGDLIGATTFESFIQHDKPTIDVMNEAGLDVSAVGNHEFDAGLRRPGQPGDGAVRRHHQPRGWRGVEVPRRQRRSSRTTDSTPWTAPGSRTSATSQVGFVGAVTEDLPVAGLADGIADIEVTDIVDATNEAADELEAEGADVIVLLVHEGAATTPHRRGDRPELRVRPDRQRRRPRRRRDHLRPHPPRLQPLDPGAGLGAGSRR